MRPDRSLSLIEAEFNDHLENIKRTIRQPSISPTNEGIDEMAQLTKDMLSELGADVGVYSTAGNPIVMGKLDVGAEKTVLIYGMYDVMPAQEDGWIVDPFAGEISELPGLGQCLVARGAINTKGPLGGFINAVSAMVRSDQLPVNLMFLIEGEEEMGSRNLPAFVEKHKHELSKCDAMMFPFFSQTDTKTPDIWLGVKGIVHLELLCEGGDWGGPIGREIHAGQAAWIASPVWKLVSALSTMVSNDEQILIKGLLDKANPPSETELELIQRLAERLDLEKIKTAYATKRFKHEGTPSELLQHYLCDVSCNIMGINGGYTGRGTKTIVPHMARATVDIRLVPEMTPKDTIECVRNHLNANGFSDVEVNNLSGGYTWSSVDVNEDIIQSAIAAYRTLGHEPMVHPRIVGSAPFYLFTSVLNMPYVMFGLGHGLRQHSANEYATIEGIKQFELSVVEFLHEYANKSR